jgi:hypothetical protein
MFIHRVTLLLDPRVGIRIRGINQPNILLSLAFMKDCHLYWELQVMAIKAVGPAEGLPEAVKVLQRPLNLRL